MAPRGISWRGEGGEQQGDGGQGCAGALRARTLAGGSAEGPHTPGAAPQEKTTNQGGERKEGRGREGEVQCGFWESVTGDGITPIWTGVDRSGHGVPKGLLLHW